MTRDAAIAKAFLRALELESDRGHEFYRTAYRDRLLMRSEGFKWYFVPKIRTYRGTDFKL